MTTKFARLAALAGVALVGTSGAFASIAFDNFGPGVGFLQPIGRTASGPVSAAGAASETAFQFQSLTTGVLDTVTLPVGWVSGTNSVNVTLYNDSGSNTVGSWFINWSWGGLPTFGTAYAPAVLSNPFNWVTLTAGTKYWISVRPGQPDTWDAWNLSTSNNVLLSGVSTDSGATYNYSRTIDTAAFRIETVPEPTSMIALGAGGIGLLLKRRRKVA